MPSRTSILALALAIAGSSLFAVTAILLSVEQARRFRGADGALDVAQQRGTVVAASVGGRHTQPPSGTRLGAEQQFPHEGLHEELARLRGEVVALRDAVEALARRGADAPSRGPDADDPEASQAAPVKGTHLREWAPAGTPAEAVDRVRPGFARIEAVDALTRVCVLTTGFHRGVQAGYVITLHHGDGSVVARARVLTVRDDLAGAEILSVSPGVEIHPGDIVRWDATPREEGERRPTQPDLAAPERPRRPERPQGEDFLPRREALRSLLGPPPLAPGSSAGEAP